MGKTTIRIALITFLIAGSASAEDYGWSLSGSSTDPNVNTGVAAASVPFNVYLWLVCSAPANSPPQGDGISAVEFSLSTNLFNAGFTPLGGALNAGDGTDLLLAVGGAVLFSGYIVYDTHAISTRVAPEDYVLAAITLYLDVVNLFLEILRVLSKLQDKG